MALFILTGDAKAARLLAHKLAPRQVGSARFADSLDDTIAWLAAAHRLNTGNLHWALLGLTKLSEIDEIRAKLDVTHIHVIDRNTAFDEDMCMRSDICAITYRGESG